MEVGVGLDAKLGLSIDEQAYISREAVRLGFGSIWSTEGPGEDAFQLCGQRWAASRELLRGGLTTGILVSAVGLRTALGLAMSAGTLSKISGGRFILGLGAGGAYAEPHRAQFGIRESSPLQLMRDYITAIKALLAGELVTAENNSVSLRSVRLAIDPPQKTPIILGALGPQMLRLGGELADGVAVGWCTPEQVTWTREKVKEGAERAGRDPSEVRIVEYIRVCVDEDEDRARRALADAMMGYATGVRRDQSYRSHFERLGFSAQLAKLDEMEDKGAPREALADAFPPDLLLSVGYFGKAEGAAPAFRRLAAGLAPTDLAILRVVSTGAGVNSVRTAMRACQPKHAALRP